MKKYILLIVALLSSVSTWAYVTYKTGTITYRIYDTATTPYASVYQDSSSVKKLTGEVVIPATVTYNDVDYSVTKIERWYYGNEVDLVLPSSISQASDISWSYVGALNSLKLPENATFTSIDLTNVSYTIRTLFVPKTVTSITIPKYSSSYGARVIGAVVVDEDNPNYATIDGVLFNKAKNTLIFYPYLKSGKTYTVPSGVTTIGSNAFWYNNNLEKVTISEGVTTIEDEAFRQNSNLYECILPNTLTTIGNSAFCDASKLEKCELPANIATIGSYAFYNCRFNPANNVFVLPGTLTSIGEYAFYAFKNPGSTTVELPATLGLGQKETTIGEYAFNCSTIDSKMTEPINLSYYAFYYVSRIYVPQGTLNTYKEKTGWNTFSDRLIEVVPADPTLETVKLTATETIDETNTLVKVSFAADVEGAQIRYKVFSGTDNSDPSEWPIYNELGSTPAPTVDVNPNGYTIKAIATKTGMNASEIFSKTYDLASMSCKAPTIICESGSTTLTISNSTEGATIEVKKYAKNTDGDYTTLVSTETYTSPLTLNGNFRYEAVSKKSGMFSSSATVKTVSWFSCSEPTISYVASKPDGTTVKVTVTGADPANEHYKYRVGSGDYLDYSVPVEVNQDSYFYAYTERENYNTSGSVSVYTYRSNVTTSKPTIGIDQEANTLTLSSDEGADIYYTLDGTTPIVTADLKYTGVITLTGNCQVNAIAHKEGKFMSDVANTTVNWFACADVVMTQEMINGQAVIRLSTTTEGATIRYGINGRDYYSPEYNTEYTEPFGYNSGDYIYAIAMKSGFNNSNWVDARFYYPEGTARCTQPSIILDNEKKLVTITTDETNGKIFYTLDGSTPTTASTLYSEPFTSEVNCTVKAITARDPEIVDEVTTTYANSEVNSRSLDDWFRVSNVIFQPVLGDAEGEYKMALLAEEGATIYYGINNSDPNIQYTDTFVVSAGDWVYAIAKKDGYVNSYLSDMRISDDNYKVRTPNIYLNDVAHYIVVTPVTYGSSIYYSYDKSDPDPESSTTFKVEKDTIDIVRNGTYKFLAVKDHMTSSDIATYNISWFRVPNVTITPFAEDNVLKVRLECKDEDGNPVPGAAIYYATSGDYDPDNLPANAPYTEPFTVEDGARVYASAQKEGYNNAYWTNSDWIYKSSYTAATPSITVAADTTVTISSTEDGAVLYYTLDGSDPTTSSTKFTSKFKMTTNGTIKAIAAVNGKLNSSIRSRDYSGYSVKSVVITPIVVDNKLMIKLESETPGAKLYYGINEYNSSTIEANLPYSVPFEIPNDSYVYAIGTKEGYTNSGWTSNGWYYYNNYTCNQPTITITADTTCIMSASEGASIYYTLNGDDPTTSSTLYTSGTSGFKLTSNVTIKAIAVQSGMMNSSIRERSYTNFRVASPVITNDGTTITITSDTPGATFKYCYEPDPRDENGNLMYSRTYTGPFDALYNSWIYVQATKDGFNSSNGDFRVPNVVKCKPVEQVSYNGHSMKLKAEEGTTIWYTVNGETPNENSNGWYSNVYQYVDSIKINNTGKIRAIATAQYKNQSDVSDFEVTSFAGETGATSDKAGGLEASMGWSTPSTIKEFTITGPINASDISFVKNKMTSLEKLDLSNATIDDGNLPDNAFADMPLLTFSSPNGLKSVGNNIFTGCDNLAAVVWNTTAKIPDNAFDADVNPNLLLFVPSEEAAPTNSSAQNIIVNGTAKNIYLSDGEGNNFHCPQGFYAQNITYTHNFNLESGDGYGWETIALPFECSRFIHESKGELLPFAAYDSLTEKGMYKPFWLRELTDVGFKDVSRIEANKPYIISMPNNESYATRYRVGGKVTFTSTDTWVPVTEPQAVQKGVNTLYANFLNDSDTDHMLLLNTEDTDEHKAGSIFVKNSGRAVRPFEAYVLSQANARAYISITRGFSDDPDGDDDTTPIETVNQQTTGKMVKVYTLSGVLVKEAAEEDALKGLAKGVYIVNGKSMIVK